MVCFVPQKKLSILETDAGNSQSMTIGVLEIMNSNRPKPRRTRASELMLVTLSGATPCRFPSRIVDPFDWVAFEGKNKFAMLPACASSRRHFHTRPRTRISRLHVAGKC
jgi:hypothetical protein